MKFIVKYYGLIADITNKSEEEFLIKDAPLALTSIKDYILTSYPELKNTTFQIAVNHEIIRDDSKIITINDEIGFLPPFAGG
jgi:sulfur-carrier protein